MRAGYEFPVVASRSLRATVHASCDARKVRYTRYLLASPPPLICEQGYTRAWMHAMGDKPASGDTRKLPSTRPTIRNRLRGAISLPAVKHVSYNARELRNARAGNV